MGKILEIFILIVLIFYKLPGKNAILYKGLKRLTGNGPTVKHIIFCFNVFLIYQFSFHATRRKFQKR